MLAPNTIGKFLPVALCLKPRKDYSFFQNQAADHRYAVTRCQLIKSPLLARSQYLIATRYLVSLTPTLRPANLRPTGLRYRHCISPSRIVRTQI